MYTDAWNPFHPSAPPQGVTEVRVSGFEILNKKF